MLSGCLIGFAGTMIPQSSVKRMLEQSNVTEETVRRFLFNGKNYDSDKYKAQLFEYHLQRDTPKRILGILHTEFTRSIRAGKFTIAQLLEYEALSMLIDRKDQTAIGVHATAVIQSIKKERATNNATILRAITSQAAEKEANQLLGVDGWLFWFGLRLILSIIGWFAPIVPLLTQKTWPLDDSFVWLQVSLAVASYGFAIASAVCLFRYQPSFRSFYVTIDLLTLVAFFSTVSYVHSLDPSRTLDVLWRFALVVLVEMLYLTYLFTSKRVRNTYFPKPTDPDSTRQEDLSAAQVEPDIVKTKTSDLPPPPDVTPSKHPANHKAPEITAPTTLKNVDYITHFCKQCGCPVSPTGNFCHRCGQRLIDEPNNLAAPRARRADRHKEAT